MSVATMISVASSVTLQQTQLHQMLSFLDIIETITITFLTAAALTVLAVAVALVHHRVLQRTEATRLECLLGARPLRRAVQHEVEDRLSEKILHGELNAGDHVHVDYLKGEFVLTTGRQAGLDEKEPAAVEA